GDGTVKPNKRHLRICAQVSRWRCKCEPDVRIKKGTARSGISRSCLNVAARYAKVPIGSRACCVEDRYVVAELIPPIILPGCCMTILSAGAGKGTYDRRGASGILRQIDGADTA